MCRLQLFGETNKLTSSKTGSKRDYLSNHNVHQVMWHICTDSSIVISSDTQVKCIERGDRDDTFWVCSFDQGSVHMSALLNVYLRRITFSLFLSRCSHQVAPPSHQCRYLSSLFSYCIQNDIVSVLVVGPQKPRPIQPLLK